MGAAVSSFARISTVGELVRFTIVGVVSNALLFVLYLVMTQLGMGHKLAATLAYAAGVLQTFVFNRSWSFRADGALRPAFFRYVAAYAFGYVINMVALVVLVDRAGYPHRWVQGVMILLLAALLFLLQKLWVFRETARGR